MAAEKGHLGLCRFLVDESGIDFDFISAEGGRPVYGAAAGGPKSGLRYLLHCVGDPVTRDSKDETPLLSKGIGVHPISSRGTPHIAVSKDQDKTHALLEHVSDDSPPPSEEITMVGSGGNSGEGLRAGRGCCRHCGYRGGLLYVLEEGFRYIGKGGGGLRDILDGEVVNMVAPTKLFHFHRGEALISDIFGKKVRLPQPRPQPQPQPRPRPQPQPRPRPRPRSQPRPRPQPRQYPKAPQPKPTAKIYKLFQNIQRTFNRFFAHIKAQVPLALLLTCGFVAAAASTFCTWNDRVHAIVVVHSGLPGNIILVIADDMFGCRSLRSELMKWCNSRTRIIVIPSSVIHNLERRHVGIDCLKTATALLLIKDLMEAGKVRLLQVPMNPNYKENFLSAVRILHQLYPEATVSIASKNKLLRF